MKAITLYRCCALLVCALAPFSCKESKNKNHLSLASSPYLKQHADNPVNWYEWGDEALRRAREENKPLLISIGYASCHWCHVMEKESFMDTAVARVMNDNFICIKVDREERPDVDDIYLNACQLISGNGGWPLNAFALPDGKPFFAGTYFPKEGWISLLKKIAEAYKHQNETVMRQAEALTKGILDSEFSFLRDNNQPAVTDIKGYQNLFDMVYKRIDLVHGGLRGTPKFPMPSTWEFILQYYKLTGDRRALDAVNITLTHMALGGVCDHAGGGFARYSTDSVWHVPHFEKMLYDNGQLLSLYSHAYQVTQNIFFKNVINELTSFIERDLTSPEGGFYCSLNADTESGEGEFYAWTFDDLKTLTGDKSDLIANYFNVSREGNWKRNKNILYASQVPVEFAIANKIEPEKFNNLLKTTEANLLAERNKRIKPATDDKILTAWNALMLKGYADAYAALGDEVFLSRALKNARFIEQHMLDTEGHLWRNFKDGKPSIDGFLDDYSLVARAFIRLYEVTFDKHFLLISQQLTEFAIKNFYDEKSGMFYYSSVHAENLVVRKIEISDNVIPSSNAMMAEVLYDLNVYFENADYLHKSVGMLSKLSGQMNSSPEYYTQWCFLAGRFSHGTYEIAIMGKDARSKNLQLQKNYLPNCLFMGETSEENLPLLENKLPVAKTLIYVCTNKTCKLPVEEISSALLQIK